MQVCIREREKKNGKERVREKGEDKREKKNGYFTFEFVGLVVSVCEVKLLRCNILSFIIKFKHDTLVNKQHLIFNY